MRFRWHPSSYLLLLALLISVGVGGCAAAGFVAKTLGGNPDVPAQYIPLKEPMLVLVENYRSPATGAESEHLGRCIESELTSQNIAPLVESSRLYSLRSKNPEAYKTKSIADIGKETGAKQVLYVDVESNSVDAALGSDMMKGHLIVKVRIVDADTGATRWPIEASDGFPVEIETPYMQANESLSGSQMREQVYLAASVDIVRLFHSWEPENAE